MKRFEIAALAAVLVVVAVGIGSLVAGLSSGESTPAPIPGESGTHVRVEVLNAAGVPGLARDGTRRLRDAGFDVVYFGNAGGGPREQSVVLDRTGRLETARSVARALQISQVRSVPDPDLYLDVSVLLGRDWRPGSASSR